MDRRESEGLVLAVAAWLAYRHSLGQNTQYEALLSVPITEYLSAQTNWQILPEQPYSKIFGASESKDYWADLAARKGGRSFALEVKMITKQSNKRRVEQDIERLSVQQSKTLRFFLLAGRIECFPKIKSKAAPKNARLFEKLLEYPYREGFGLGDSYVQKWAHHEASGYRVQVWKIGFPKSRVASLIY